MLTLSVAQTNDPTKDGTVAGFKQLGGQGARAFRESQGVKFNGLIGPCGSYAYPCRAGKSGGYDGGNWFYAVGSFPGPCGAKFPGEGNTGDPDGGCSDMVQLWVASRPKWGGRWWAGCSGRRRCTSLAGSVTAVRAAGRRGRARRCLRATRCMHARHAKLPCLVLDGVAFFRTRIAGSGGYEVVAAAAPAAAALSFAKGDSEECESSKG